MTALSEGLMRFPFSHGEFRSRRELLLEEMRRRGMDAALVSNGPNFFYLTGMPINVSLGLFTLLLKKDGSGYWLGRRTEMSNVRVYSDVMEWSEEGAAILDEEEPYEALARGVTKIIGANAVLGVELATGFLPPSGLDIFRRVAPSLHVVDSSGMVETLRAVKSTEEVELLRQSGRMTADTLKKGIASIKEGMTDSALSAVLYTEALRLGSESFAWGPTVTVGRRSAMAHSTFANLPMRRGELINMEMAAAVSRYCAPCFRIAIIGRPSEEARSFHDASLAGLQAGLKGIGPGMTSHEADRIVREAIDRAGYLEYFTVRAAYSVGIGFAPSWDEDHIMKLRPKDRRIIKPGMVFHLVPALYKLGVGAVCCSSSIVVTDNGVEVLTPIEPQLFVVE
ncbi:MAG: M24 family metallopeptidase [Hyphomicrobium sp.]|uniref:M24 family metallopeptidase n=1 Tax=Hyphomicrobium sp. TaxID=82 RepID=UPI003D102044